MRRLSPVLLGVTVVACGAMRDAFSAHPDIAASAAGQDLSVEQLAGWVARAPKLEPKRENVAAVAALYVDYMVYGAQLARGVNLRDSALVLATNWPLVSQIKWDKYHEQLTQARTHVIAGQVDSAYAAGDVRLLQHILIQVTASAAPPEVEQKRALAERLLREASAQHGAKFGTLARRYSEDPGSKDHDGYLGAGSRGQFVAPFAVAAWELKPGEISPVVRSPFGFHIIRRPPLEEVRDAYTADLSQVETSRFDSTYVEDLAQRKHVAVKEGAPAIMRQVFSDIEGGRTDGRTLVSYTGGAFRVKDLVRWIMAINPQEIRSLPAASDDQLREFLRAATARDLLLQEVDSAGIALTTEEWERVRSNHDSALHLLDARLGFTPSLWTDSAATPDARLKVAASHVTDYLGRVVTNQASYFPVPAFLADALRERETWSISHAGVGEAAERAKTLRGQPDSTQGGMRRAPGPPPIPVDTGHRRTIQ
ncbi:MAG TPA: peptidylprolyl isomerase [Gemmatimonadales bacterium]|nr:peptidylprolyl isomerase [Gemmatimonadales bacterium]